jgi:hypothetical protein
LTSRLHLQHVIAAGIAVAGAGVAATALALPASAPAAAQSAAIKLGHPCYLTAEKATLTGTGFDPSARWRATLDGSKFGSGKTNSTGDITATFGVPSHLRTGSTGEDSYKIVVSERKHRASATFLVTHLDANFSPQSGSLSTLKVRFQLLGWGRGGSLYLHYISPKGVVRQSRDLGTPGGACGHLTTGLLKLFPFTPKVGKWTLQFDKNAVYKPKSVPRVVIPYKIS